MHPANDRLAELETPEETERLLELARRKKAAAALQAAKAPRNPYLEILETLGPEPQWVACRCGALVSCAPCWDCEMSEARRANRGALAGVPARYAWACPEAPELASRVQLHPAICPYSVNAALARLRGASRALLVGAAQKGKTSLAVAALRGRKCEAFFCRAETLGLSRRQAKYGAGESGPVARALETGLLLLDDVGSEGDERDRIQAVKDVLFDRYEQDRPTWVTTGLDSTQIEARYGAGILARMRSGVVLVMAERAGGS